MISEEELDAILQSLESDPVDVAEYYEKMVLHVKRTLRITELCLCQYCSTVP